MTLKEARKQAGLTQVELAKRVRRAQQTVSEYETGAKAPNVRLARQIERLLGCRPGEIEWPEGDEASASGQ